MTTVDAAGVARAAASAALAVPGVVRLQPSLGESLAGAAGRVGHARGSRPAAPANGVHAERAPGSGAWRVEVRCVLDGERRPLDTARLVRESVRSAVVSHTARHGAAASVTVLVTVTRIIGR